MIGTTRSRISFFMNKFRRQGHIGYSGDTRDLQVYPSLYSVLVEDDAHHRFTDEVRAAPPQAPKRPSRR